MDTVERPVAFNAPWSGPVNQTINPWNWAFDLQGAQIGLFNINLGTSSNPQVEHRILDEVGSYGRQLGRISEALEVLTDRLDRSALTPAARDAIDAFRGQMADIRKIKRGAAAGDDAASQSSAKQ